MSRLPYPKKTYQVKTVYSMESGQGGADFDVLDYSDNSYVLRFHDPSSDDAGYKEAMALNPLINHKLKDEHGKIFSGLVYKKADVDTRLHWVEVVGGTIEEFNEAMNISTSSYKKKPNKSSSDEENEHIPKGKVNSGNRTKTSTAAMIPGVPQPDAKEESSMALEQAMTIILEAMRNGTLDDTFILRKNLSTKEPSVGCVGFEQDQVNALLSNAKNSNVKTMFFSVTIPLPE